MTNFFYNDWMKATVWFVIIPMFVTSVVIHFLHSNTLKHFLEVSRNTAHISRFTRVCTTYISGGDPNMKVWCFILTVCPAVYIIIDTLVNFELTYKETALSEKGKCGKLLNIKTHRKLTK